MKIYFSGSIRGGRKDAAVYNTVIEKLMTYGHVLTAFIGDPDLPETDEEGVSDRDIWQRDYDWVEEADVLVAEVTQPSLGVGYEIGIANKVGTPVLALYRQQEGKRLSGMIGGDPNVHTVEYHRLIDALVAVDQFMDNHK